MTKRVRGFQKIGGGFKWTRSGFVKMPDRMRSVSLAAQPLKQKNAAKFTPDDRRQPEGRLGVKRQEKGKEQGRTDSAPTAAPDAAKPAPQRLRRSWRGTYDDLTKPTERGA